ncbi:MAG TPA: hypothetical protein VHA37_04590 [Candidatus Saccharimonadales bacterium]|nr:hypothetical protein [Candidatus Saccharimonadales bacterium]
MNYKDVALLNGSLDSLSSDLLHSRMLAQQQQSQQADQALRGQQLDVEKQRAQTDDDFRKAQLAHYDTMEKKGNQGNVNTWLQSDDGGTMNFQGPPDALTALESQAEQAGKPLKRVDPPKTPAPFGEVSKTLADGSRMTFHARNQEEFNNATAIVSKLPGFTPPQKPGAAAVQVMGQVQDYRQKAQDAADAGDQDTADQFNHAADVLEGTLKKKEVVPPGLRKSVATADPRNPGSKTTISGPADQVDQAMAPKPLDPATAAQFLQQAGGDKNKARQLARQAGYQF